MNYMSSIKFLPICNLKIKDKAGGKVNKTRYQRVIEKTESRYYEARGN